MSEERLTIQETWAKLTRATCPRDVVYPCGDNCYACWRTHAPEMLVALVDGDYPRVRRALSAVDPVTAGLERMARAYGRRLEAQREAFIVLNSRESTGKQKDTATGPVWDAKGEEDKAWKALLDAGWTGESESTP